MTALARAKRRAAALIPVTEGESHWTASARSLVTGSLLFIDPKGENTRPLKKATGYAPPEADPLAWLDREVTAAIHGTGPTAPHVLDPLRAVKPARTQRRASR